MKSTPGPDRDIAHRRAGDDETEGVDRIARARHQHDIARRRDRLGEVGEPLLGAEGDDDLRLGIELDTEAPPVIARLRAPQPGDAARHRIAVGARILHRLDQLVDDMGGRRPVGIAHAEIDHVAPGRSRLRLQGIHFGENIGRQALDTIEIFGHGGSWIRGWLDGCHGKPLRPPMREGIRGPIPAFPQSRR